MCLCSLFSPVPRPPRSTLFPYTRSSDLHVLLLGWHHVVSDGWSRGVLFRELGTLYGAYRDGDESPLPKLPVQYADYAEEHTPARSEDHTSELQSPYDLVCRLLLVKKNQS